MSFENFKIEMPKVESAPAMGSVPTCVPLLIRDRDTNETSTVIVAANSSDPEEQIVMWFDEDGSICWSHLEHLQTGGYDLIRAFQAGDKLVVAHKG